MKYQERLENLRAHISNHPTDYQAVIGYLKLNSKDIEHDIHLRRVEKAKLIAKCKKERS